jgi:Protein of unknown function (DUF3800)
MTLPIGYVAYIDEAGDDGLKLKSNNDRKASEWMVIAAVLIKSNSESHVIPWTRAIINKIDQHQITHLHFRTLKDEKKLIVCEELANLNVRIFAVLSHKHNMIGYRNLRAEKAKVNRTAWFYCWMTRLLMEKVTAYCGRRSLRDYGEYRPIRCEFSDRGGVKIDDIQAYYKYLSDQSRLGMMYHKGYDLDWRVFSSSELFIYPNKMRAGLQLADCAASAFFAGLESTPDGIIKPAFAKALIPRICPDHKGRRYGFGVRTMPTWAHNVDPKKSELRDFLVRQ